MLMLNELHNWLLLMDLNVETMASQNRPLGPCQRNLERGFQFHKLFHREKARLGVSRKPKVLRGLPRHVYSVRCTKNRTVSSPGGLERPIIRPWERSSFARTVKLLNTQRASVPQQFAEQLTIRIRAPLHRCRKSHLSAMEIFRHTALGQMSSDDCAESLSQIAKEMSFLSKLYKASLSP